MIVSVSWILRTRRERRPSPADALTWPGGITLAQCIEDWPANLVRLGQSADPPSPYRPTLPRFLPSPRNRGFFFCLQPTLLYSPLHGARFRSRAITEFTQGVTT